MERCCIVIDLLKMVVVLTVISCVAALLVAFTNSKTARRIVAQQEASQQEALQRIMPAGVSIERKTAPISPADSLTYWTGISGSDTVYAFRVSSRGYSSAINYMVCTTAEGIIEGMTVLDQNETPGLGTRMQEVISKKYFWNGLGGPKERSDPWFSEQFKGIDITHPIKIDKSVGEWHRLDEKERSSLRDHNSVTAITGSTISTRAVARGLTMKAQTYLKAIRG